MTPCGAISHPEPSPKPSPAAGRAEIATLLVSCSEVVFEEIGAAVLGVARMNERTLAIIRSHLDEAAFADAWEQGRALTLDDACDLALEALD